MDAVPNPTERPEDLLDALAAGEDNLGARLLRLAREAAAFDRANILDLLCDDSPAAAEEAPSAAEEARYDVRVTPVVRRTEAAR